MKHKQVLMRQQQEIIFCTVCFSVAGCTAVVLLLDDDFFGFEPNGLKNLHYIKAHWNNMTFFPRVRLFFSIHTSINKLKNPFVAQYLQLLPYLGLHIVIAWVLTLQLIPEVINFG